MKAEDVVLKLAANLPQLVDNFTDNHEITSLTSAGFTATAVTAAPHNMVPGKGVSIVGAQTPLVITTLTRVGIIGTLVTSLAHDITKVPTTVVIDGANEAEFNGEFNIISVPDRFTVNFSLPDSGATIATGSPLLLNGTSALQQYNGVYSIVSVPTPTSFTYTLSNDSLYSPAMGSIKARGNARISSAASIEDVFAVYDENPAHETWLFVVLDDVNASKKRQILSDATDNTQRQDYFRQQIIQSLGVFLFIPTGVNQIAGRQARDLAEELFRPICQSILFEKFDSYLFVGAFNPLQFTSAGFQGYNGATYVHRFSFEQMADLLFEDTVGYSEDVAFRDIDFSMTLDVGTQVDALTADINLDDEIS